MGRGKSLKGRALNGVLLLDKSSGRSSNFELQRAKFLFKARKAGHTGSLDPLASGLLPVCFGEATKISNYLLEGDKRYFVRIKLGLVTDTGDKEGNLLETRPVDSFKKEDLDLLIARFVGEIEQVPPMYSALKHKGQRLYELARKGIEVERPPRKVTIYQLNLLDFGEDFVELDVCCSKGTYIRTLAEDMGEALGCGGHVEVLRRTAVNRFDVKQAFTLAQLECLAEEGDEALCSVLRPVDEALEEWPSCLLTESQSWHIRQGQPIRFNDLKDGQSYRMYESGGKFIGVGQRNEEGLLAPKRIFNL